ncbi:c-type cytochrome biogenesis protein CcmI [Chitinibacter sp. GC72]|uniref:c-type cytochrome biogenesis protein CcmI n=1 Tax=Chitinibacter sp. GC72 TaxID=1526917 RepID=UPI0012F7E17E|nr:c-type cytochrome biogenesis protein CcmI [Chitinibacter sp. GC72]
MNEFALLCAALVMLTLLVLLYPLLRQDKNASIRTDTEALRRARYQMHASVVAELQADVATGRLNQAEYAASLAEAETRLIAEAGRSEVASASTVDTGADVGAGAAVGGSTLQSRSALLGLIGIGLPLLAALLYFQLGNPAALNPLNRQAAPEGSMNAMMDAAKIEGMVKSLEAKMALEPDNVKGWLMLARSYRTLARYDEAVKAYEKAWPAVQKDAGEMARFAGSLAVRDNSFAGRPTQLLARALEMNAREPDALMLAGSAALQRGDHAAAIQWWEKLLALLESESEDAQWLREEIRLVKEDAQKAASQAASAHAQNPE